MSRDDVSADSLPEVVAPLRFPLHGSRLIEASAGTGKTFTIAALYVRLVLGHGGEHAFMRPLTPPEILVVTFTDAATKELRDRIRARLAEAAEYFRADLASVPDLAPGADLLHDLRAEYPPDKWPACARKLQLGAEWMDEAAVSTIHAWCNRMLREHAFDSGSLFTQALETDQSELLAEVVRDYWRTFMVALDDKAAEEVLRRWTSPDELNDDLRQLVAHAELLAPANDPAAALGEAQREKAQRLQALKAPWATWVSELQVLLDAARDKKAFDGIKLKKNNYDGWLQKLADWRDDADSIRPGLTDAAMRRLTPAGLAEIWKDGESPRHPALDAIAALDHALQDLPDALPDVLRHAARWVSERFAVEQDRRAQMGFNDLLTRLDGALRGSNGGRLAHRIRQKFPVALIDEFQDTDPVQYRIFDTVYRVAENAPDSGLVLIGDPKQAIYAFRGADIYTYLTARRDCAGRLYTLKRNFRSTEAMVTATNRCFASAEARSDGAGAFLFRDPRGNPVPFTGAEAQGRKDVLEIDGAPPPPFTAWWLPAKEGGEPISKGAYFAQMAAACATEMTRLLNLGQTGRAVFVSEGKWRPLRPADMAVLVHTRAEADAIRAALAERGVRSVYLSDRDSVFKSPQATELQSWLAACAEPDDPRLLRAALATSTLGLAWAELDALKNDEMAWEARVVQFRGYRDCWRRQGILPMLRRLLNDFGVPARLLRNGAGEAAGERILTDLLQLAELLQQASGLLDGEHALIRHLAEQRQQDGGDDARQIRLESDADLVQVVTVHKSKGLEYPLVFLPFACSFRKVKADDLPLKYHDDDGRLRLALSAGDASIVGRADRERLGEDLRKLYVALTRARHATWVGLAPLNEVERSAFGYLLSGGQYIAPDVLEGFLTTLADGCAAIVVAQAPEPTGERIRLQAAEAAGGRARSAIRPVREHWWIASYSALHTVGSEKRVEPETPDQDVFQETLEMAESAPPLPATRSRGTLHDFPRGAAAGSFLHDLLEWAAREGFAEVLDTPERARDTVARRCAARGWQAWIDPLTTWLLDFLETPLRLPATDGVQSTPVSLSRLWGPVAEMEFWLAAGDVGTADVDRLVCARTLDGAARPQLQAARLNGMLKGFIDLVFEHDGRYYVADYKSNWLGADDAAYTPAAMRAAILASRYDLQYVLYLLALHRLLKARLPDYDYDKHVGGAVYLFLRGNRAAEQGIHADRPPRALIEAIADPDRAAAKRAFEAMMQMRKIDIAAVEAARRG